MVVQQDIQLNQDIMEGICLEGHRVMEEHQGTQEVIQDIHQIPMDTLQIHMIRIHDYHHSTGCRHGKWIDMILGMEGDLEAMQDTIERTITNLSYLTYQHILMSIGAKNSTYTGKSINNPLTTLIILGMKICITESQREMKEEKHLRSFLPLIAS